MQTDYPPFVEPTTEAIQVMVSTPNYILEGQLYLPRTMKENRRLTNILNSDRRFIALTQVTLTDRKTGETDQQVYPFIQLNLTMVELIKPLEPVALS